MDEVPEQQSDTQYTFKPFRVPKYKITFQNASSLKDIPGYVWYTPAALYLWGSFNETVLSDIVSKKEIDIFWYSFDKPIFKHFNARGDNSWNHGLWAAKEEDWKKLSDGVLEAVQFDIPNKALYQYALQSLTIPDPLQVDRDRVVTPKTAHVDIKAFAVLTNKAQYAFDSKLSGVPGMSKFKPSKLHVNAADKLFSIPNLNTDRAFEGYKAILEKSQDETAFAKHEKEWRRNNGGK